MTGTSSLRGGSYGGGTGQGASGGGRLQQKIEEAKEKRRERHQAKRRPDEISTRSLPRDEQGIAHDSECAFSCLFSSFPPQLTRPPPTDVQFRTATPLHVQQRQQTIAENPDEDDSASSSSASSTSSGFRSSSYTYQSTHRTASSSHHQSSISAVPSHIASHHRSSFDSGPSSLGTQRPSSRDRHGVGASSSSLYGDSAAYDRIGPGYGSRVTTSKLRSASTPTMHHHHHGPTTASYQPPAPAFHSRPNGVDTSLRNPHPTSDSSSLAGSTAQLSLGSGTIDGGATSGYTKAIKAGHAASSIRPPQLEGSALDAGVHGMKRQADLFKLETRLFAHKLAKKATRKLAL